MKTKALRGRELTSQPLPPSSTARRINWPRLYGNLTPHEHTNHTRLPFHFPPFRNKNRVIEALLVIFWFLTLLRLLGGGGAPRRVNTPDGGRRARIERLPSPTCCLSGQTAAEKEKVRQAERTSAAHQRNHQLHSFLA